MHRQVGCCTCACWRRAAARSPCPAGTHGHAHPGTRLPRPAPCRPQTLRHHSGAYKPFVREVRMRPELEGYDTLATCQVDYEFEEANKVG